MPFKCQCHQVTLSPAKNIGACNDSNSSSSPLLPPQLFGTDFTLRDVDALPSLLFHWNSIWVGATPVPSFSLLDSKATLRRRAAMTYFTLTLTTHRKWENPSIQKACRPATLYRTENAYQCTLAWELKNSARGESRRGHIVVCAFMQYYSGLQ